MEISGTAFLVDGTWYLRHVGGGGSMLLVETNDVVKAKLVEGSVTVLTGHIGTDGNGCPQRVIASEVTVVAKP